MTYIRWSAPASFGIFNEDASELASACLTQEGDVSVSAQVFLETPLAYEFARALAVVATGGWSDGHVPETREIPE